MEVCPVPVGDVPDAVSDGFVFALPRPRCPGENVETPMGTVHRPMELADPPLQNVARSNRPRVPAGQAWWRTPHNGLLAS